MNRHEKINELSVTLLDLIKSLIINNKDALLHTALDTASNGFIFLNDDELICRASLDRIIEVVVIELLEETINTFDENLYPVNIEDVEGGALE